MLLALNKRDRLRGASLRKSAELSQNTQVFYRMEEHLIPAGLVTEHDRRHEQDQRRFSLTDAGASWLEAHEEEVAMPKSRVETQQMAHEALEEASSAKKSVQDYRHKVSEMKSDVEETADHVEQWISRKNDHWQDLERRSDRTRTLAEENEERVDNIEKNRSRSIQRTASRFTDNEEAIAALQTEVQSLQEENEQLRAMIEAIQEEMKKGHLDRLRERLVDD